MFKHTRMINCVSSFTIQSVALALVGVSMIVNAPNCAAQDSETEIQATGCFLRLKDEANVPARDQGVLKEISVELGDLVTESQLLATLEDQEAALTLQLAEVDLAIATKRKSESVAVEIAEAAVEESAKLLEQAKIELSVARKTAESDIALRQATAAKLLAQDKYDRGVASRNQFSSSISELEMADRKYQLDNSRMEIEQARYEQGLQHLRSDGRSVFVEQQQVAGRRLKFELSDARTERDVFALTVDRMKKTVEMAKEQLARRQLRSPLSGIVVEKLHHKGEWVEAGEPVLRIIRIDTLLVEGYVQVGLLDQSSRGRDVRVTRETRGGPVTLKGKLVFVSPETDSVNRQILIKAEVENVQQALLPGEPVDMVVSGVN